jgi:protein-S-isoprenylcysteine O-methyltransferase Ste14
MKSAPLDFRLRFWIFMMIYTLGFLAPWNWALHLDGRGPNAHAWGLLAVNLAKTSGLAIDAAFNVVLSVAIVCAFTGAWLRTWASAYIGADVMRDRQLRGEAVVADGPYRFLRNPLYLGNIFNTLALAVLMPASGAVFTIVMVVLLQIRLVLAEEPFLTQRLGAAYVEYCKRVPRFVPALRPRVPASGERARWLEAALAEIFQWGVAGSFAAVGWRYNAGLLLQCVLVSLGVSLVVRAFPLRRERVQAQG